LDYIGIDFPKLLSSWI